MDLQNYLFPFDSCQIHMTIGKNNSFKIGVSFVEELYDLCFDTYTFHRNNRVRIFIMCQINRPVEGWTYDSPLDTRY